MKYYYEPQKQSVRVFGKPINLEHLIYRAGTLFEEHGKGLIIVQKYFSPEWKSCYWDRLEYGIANDIYTSPKFYDFFDKNAKDSDYQIFELRKVMWELRMKPLQKEEWEEYF